MDVLHQWSLSWDVGQTLLPHLRHFLPLPLHSLTLVFAGLFLTRFASPHCLCNILSFLKHTSIEASSTWLMGSAVSCSGSNCVAGHFSHKSHPSQSPFPTTKNLPPTPNTFLHHSTLPFIFRNLLEVYVLKSSLKVPLKSFEQNAAHTAINCL